MIEQNNMQNGLPKDWVWTKFSDVAEVNPRIPNRENISDDLEVQFLPMKLVEELNGKIHLIEYKTYGELKKGYTPFIDGDVIFAKVTPCMENGKIAIVEKLKNEIGFGSSEFHVIRSKASLLNKYVFYYLIQQKFRNDAEHAMTGAVGLRRVPKQFIENSQLPLPTVEVQHKIVSKIEELFSELDKGIEELKTTQQQLKVYRQAVLKWAFEGKLTKSNLTWKKIRLGDVALAVDPQPSHRTPPKVENGVPYVSTKDFDYEQDKIDFSNARMVSSTVLDEHLERYRLEVGDFVIGKIGTIGNPVRVVLPQNYTLSANIVLIQPRKVDKTYLYYFFQSNFIEKEFQLGAKATTQAAFGIQKVRELNIHLPCNEEQQQIVQEIESRLSVCHKIEETITNSLKQTEALRQSILKRAFEGCLL
jgi:type I restriction enzyme, S subunit